MNKELSGLPMTGRLSIARRMSWMLVGVGLLALAIIACLALTASNLLGTGSPASQMVLLEGLGLSFGLLVALALVLWLMNRTVFRPLTDLVLFTTQIRQGATARRLSLTGPDEMMIVAAAINAMLDTIVGQHDRLQAQVNALREQVSGVAHGDLRGAIEITADALGELAMTFNYILEQLSSLIVRVKVLTNEVNETTIRTHTQTRQVVGTATQQLRQMKTATQQVQQMAEACRLVAACAAQLGSETRNARQLMLEGQERVEEILRGMSVLHTSVQETATYVQRLAVYSGDIQEMVRLLDPLAQQTNRLALDAAIQASLVGDQNQGFKAIAEAIRRLSETMKEQIKQIGMIVRGVNEAIQAADSSMSSTREEASKGDTYIRETATRFEAIFQLVLQQARGINLIQEQTQQQLVALPSIESLMQEASHATQTSTGKIQVMETNLSVLAHKASQLAASVEAFHVRQAQGWSADIL